MEFPRVLHVGGQPIGAPTNTGLTLATMFGGWPDAHLMQVSLKSHPDALPRGETYLASAAVAPLDALLRGTLGEYARARRRFIRDYVAPEPDGLNSSIRRTRDLTLRRQAISSLQIANEIGPVCLPPGLRRRVRRFRPDVIHSLLGGVRVMRLALALSRYLEVPIVPHFMDDWVDTLFTDGQLGGRARLHTEQVFQRVMDQSPLCLTIGADMAREFEHRLQRPCFIVGNSVNVDDFRREDFRVSAADEPLVMRYIGGLHLGRHEVLADLAHGLEDALFEGRSWRLELFVPDADKSRARRLADRFNHVAYGGNLDPGDVPSALVTADALLFLESELSEIVDFTRLSVSTKVPQYLAAGRPILVMGPPNQGSVLTLQRVASSVYAGPSPERDQVLRSLGDLTRIVLQAQLSAPNPEWFVPEFGQAATQERLRAAMMRAIQQRVSDVHSSV